MAFVFEQTQSIVTRIRQILLEYPYGNAIFLELLQNADDAGANAVKVVFETFSANATHPAASSPALVVFNSAQFTDRDLQNIQYIGGLDATSKRHDATKVGRFGIGFNSCYHVADVVAFVSGTNLLIFDPQRDRLPLHEGRHVGGLRWDFTKCLADPQTTPEQRAFLEPLLAAFEAAGLGFRRDRPFDGTIFRLPLRRRPSDLWKELHAPRDMVSLLLDLRECAQLGMTLLKNVASVAAFVRRGSSNAGGSGSASPLEQVFAVDAGERKDEATRARINKWLQAYTAVVQRIMTDADTLRGHNVDYLSPEWVRRWTTLRQGQMAALPHPCGIDLDLVIHTAESPLFGALQRSIAAHATTDAAPGDWDATAVGTNGGDDATTLGQYLVRHQFGPAAGWEASAAVWKIAERSALNNRPVDVPWSAVIVNVHEEISDGRLMCFFPIRQGTGLPVHVHGYFHLSSDRQSIKAVDQDEWNMALVSEVTPAAYAGALLATRQHTIAHFYALFPTRDYTDRTIARIARGAMAAIFQSPLFFTATGQWVPLSAGKLPLVAPDVLTQQGQGLFMSVPTSVQVPLHSLLVECAAATKKVPLITCPSSQQRSHHAHRVPLIEHLQKIADIATYSLQRAAEKQAASALLTQKEVRDLLAHIPREAARRLCPADRQRLGIVLPEDGTTILSGPSRLALTLFRLCAGSKQTMAPDALAGLPLVALANGGVVWARALPPSLRPALSSSNSGGAAQAPKKKALWFVPFFGARNDPSTTTPQNAAPAANHDDAESTFPVSDPEHSPYLVAPSAATYALGAILFPSLLVVSDFAPLPNTTNGEETALAASNTRARSSSSSSSGGITAEDVQCIGPYARQTHSAPVQEMLGLRLISMATVSKFMLHAIESAPAGSRCLFAPIADDEWYFTMTEGPDHAAGSSDPPFLIPSPALFEFISQEWAAASSSAGAAATACAAALDVMPVFPTLSFPPVPYRSAASVHDGRRAAAPLVYVPSGADATQSTAVGAEAIRLCEQLSLLGLASVIDTAVVPAALLAKLSSVGIQKLDGAGLAQLLEKGLPRLMQARPAAALFPLSAAIARALPPLAGGITVEAAAALAALPIYRTVDGRLCAIRHKGTGPNAALPISPEHPATLILPSVEALVAATTAADGATDDSFFASGLQKEYIANLYQRLAQRAPTAGINVLSSEEYSIPAFVAFAADILKVRVATPLEVLLLAVFVVGPAPAASTDLSQPTLDLWVWTALLRSLASASAPAAVGHTDTIQRHLLDLVGQHRCLVDLFTPADGPVRLVAPSQAIVFFGECEEEIAAHEVIALIHLHYDSVPRQGHRAVAVFDHIVPAGCERAHLRRGIALIGAATKINGAHAAALVEMFGIVIRRAAANSSSSSSNTTPATPVTHHHVRLVLKVVENAAVEAADGARIEQTAFIPSKSAAQYILVHTQTASSRTPNGSHSLAHTTIVTPGQCRVEAVFRTCPLAHFCLPDVLSHEEFPRCTSRYRWAQPSSLAELLAHNAAACKSADERSNAFNASQHVDPNPGTATNSSAPAAKAPPPPQFHRPFGRECLLAMERILAKKDSESRIPADTRLYLQDHDAAVGGHQISLHYAAIGTDPLFYYLSKDDLPHLLNAVQARPHHTLDEIAAATRVAPMLHPAGAVSADITKVKITDKGRTLYKHLLGYFEAVVKAGSATTSQAAEETRRQVQALNLIVPTADGGVNLSSKVSYHYNADENDGSVAPSSTALWAGIQPSVAKAAGMAHAGLRVVMQQGRSPFIRPRGQQVSLIDGLRRILEDYSDESSVLFEMVQNADDAKATSVHIYIDERTLPAAGEDETFFGRNMKLLQGPALVIVNDSQFTTEDISALMDVGCGHKTKRPDTIGRFGIGFNAVYHVTDCPTIVTGDHTLILDPAIAYIEGSDAQAGFAIQHTRVPNLRQHYPEQLAAFKQYDVDFTSVFPKSLFRLPLRTQKVVEQFAGQKMMSSRVWDIEKAKKLVVDFGTLAESTLLFLNHLTKIEASVVSSDGKVTPLFSTKVHNVPDVQKHREMIRRDLVPFGAAHPTTGAGSDNNEGQERSRVTKIHVGRSLAGAPEKLSVYKVVVVARRGLGAAVDIPADFAAKVSLWGAIAVPIEGFTSLPQSSTFRGGRLHCFLPLPIGGLPFHVHAAFALKSDRRSLWTRSTMTGTTAEWQATYNQAILSEVLPRAFCISMADFGSHVKSIPQHSSYYWSQFPAFAADDTTEAVVQDLCRQLYTHVLDHDEPVLLTQEAPIALCSPSSVLFLPTRHSNTGNNSAFIVSEDLLNVIREILQGVEKRIIEPPVALLDVVATKAPNLMVSPQTVGALVGSLTSSFTISIPAARVFSNLAANASPRHITERCRLLIQYIGQANNNHNNVGTNIFHGTPLIVTQGGYLAIVNPNRPCFRLADNADANTFPTLCPHLDMSHSVVHNDFPISFDTQLLIESLKSVTALSTILRRLKAEPGFRFLESGQWSGDPDSLAGRWLIALWEHILNNAFAFTIQALTGDSTLFKTPLVPTMTANGPRLHTIEQLKNLSGESELSVALSKVVRLAGIQNLDPAFPLTPRIKALFNIQQIPMQQVLERLAGAPQEITSNLSPMERDELRHLLLDYVPRLKSDPNANATAGYLRNLATLPIFRRYSHASAVAHNASAGGGGLPYEGDFTALPLAPHQGQQGAQGASASVVHNVFALPPDVPRSSACNGLLMSSCEALGVKDVDKDTFLTTRLIPQLGSMSLDDEMAFWAFAAKTKYPFSDRAASLLTVRTSRCQVSLSETVAGPRGAVPLAVQLVEKCAADNLWADLSPDVAGKYATLKEALDRQYAGDSRTGTFAAPLLNQRAETPVPNVLHRLHALLFHRQLVIIPPLALPYAGSAHPEVLPLLLNKAKQSVVPEADLLAAIVEAFPKMAFQDIVREFAPGRTAIVRGVLTVVSLAVASEMHARLVAMNDTTRRGSNDHPPFSRGTLKNIHLVAAPPLEDDAELRTLAHGIRGCPSALPEFTSLALPWACKGDFLPVSSLVAYRHRWACWTQCPLLHPSMSVLEDLSLPAPPEAVVRHLETIIRHQVSGGGDTSRVLRYDLFERATKAAYQALAAVPAEELRKIPNIAGKELFWTYTNNTVRPCPHTSVIVVPLSVANHAAALQPYFIPLSEVKIPESTAVINLIHQPSIPKPSAVLAGLRGCITALKQAESSALAAGMRATYEAILRLLVASCREHSVDIDALESCRQLLLVPEGGTLDSFGCILNTCQIPVPLWRAQGFQRLADVCQPDNHALLARLDERARIADLPIDLCQKLKMTSMAMRITETPTAFDPFSVADSANLQYGGAVGGLGVLANQVRLLNAFFRSVVFTQALARIAAHDQRHAATAMFSSTAEAIAVTLRGQLPRAGALQIVLARRLRTTITDNRFPDEPIFREEQQLAAGDSAGTVVCIHLHTSTIFVDPVLLLTRRMALCPVIVRELNRFLGNGLTDPSPLLGLLMSLLHPPMALERTLCDRRLPHWDANVHAQLDLLGCGDADKQSVRLFVEGNIEWSNAAAVLRVSELTAADFQGPQRSGARLAAPKAPPCASRVVDRFLLVGDDPLAAAEAVSTAVHSSTQQQQRDSAQGSKSSAELRERDLALFATSWDDPFGAVPLPELVGTNAAPTLITSFFSESTCTLKKSALLFKRL